MSSYRETMSKPEECNVFTNQDSAKPADSDEIRAELLAMLVAFDAYCRDNDLDYSLIAGSLLGAIRNGEIIPWDDDGDVCLPRPDYERLMASADDFQKKTGYFLRGHFDMPLDISPVVKLSSPNIFTKPTKESKACPLWIDVNPVDGLPDDHEKVVSIYKRTRILRRTFSLLGSDPAGETDRKKATIKMLATPLRLARWPKTLVARILTWESKRIPYGSTNHVGIISWGYADERECNDYDTFAQKIDVELGGHPMRAMSCWDDYLTRIYGPSYIEPPNEEWVFWHLNEAWHTVPNTSQEAQ